MTSTDPEALVNQAGRALALPTESPLARLELACRLLVQARDVDEVKAVVDLAEAARIYARQARLGLEAQNDAAEIPLRAERRAGELVADMRMHAGGRPPQDGTARNRLRTVSGFASPARLSDLQITYRHRAQWQQLAAVPDPVFEAHIRTTRSRQRELTTAGALALVRQHRPPQYATPHPTEMSDASECAGHRLDVADAAHLPWPDGQVDLIVTSPPYALGVRYSGGDVSDYSAWLDVLALWLAEMLRVANPAWERLCLNVPLDRDLGGWEPVSSDTVEVARRAGWRFRTRIVWDKLQAGAGTDRGAERHRAGGVGARVLPRQLAAFGTGRHAALRMAGAVRTAWLVAVPRRDQRRQSGAISGAAALALHHLVQFPRRHRRRSIRRARHDGGDGCPSRTGGLGGRPRRGVCRRGARLGRARTTCRECQDKLTVGYFMLVFTCAACGAPAQANPQLVMSMPARWDGRQYVPDSATRRQPICEACARQLLARSEREGLPILSLIRNPD